MNEEQKDLVTPDNCLPLDYIVIGFTQKDIVAICVWIVIALVAAIGVYQWNSNSIISVALVILIAIISISIYRRDRYGENVFDKLRIFITYQNAQKQYEYKYVDAWEQEITYEVKIRRK